MDRLRHLHGVGSVSRATLVAVAAVAIGACGSSAATTTASGPATPVPQSVSPTIDIPQADRFAPFITVARTGSEVVLHNGDTDAHTVTSVPGSPLSFDVHLAGGETERLSLPLGTYRFYCTIHAHYDAATGQISANQSADHPNEPMEGVLVVG